MLLVNLIFSLISGFVSIFLTAHIFILLDESFVALGLFSLVNFIFVLIFQMVGGAICKRKNPLLVIRLSAILSFFLLSLVLILDEQLIYYYIVLALLWGSIVGFYFSAQQFLVAKKTSGEKMLRFVATYTTVASALQLFFPITFGLVIHYGSFFMIGLVILILAVLLILATLLIKNEAKIEKTRKLDFKNY